MPRTMKIPTARKLSSGSWFIQLRLGGESISITERSEKECIRQAQYIKSEYLAGKREKAADKLPTLSDAIDDYIKSKSNILSPSTIRGYRTIQRTRFKGQMGLSLSDISAADWIQACNQEATLCSAKTLTNAWRFLVTVIRSAGGTPPSVTLPQVVPNERPFLDAAQIKAFISATNGDPYQIPALLALSSLRESEILGLKWEHVDLTGRRILVKGAVVPDEHHKFVLKPTNKNRTSTRYVPILMDELYNALAGAKEPSGPVVTFSSASLLRHINQICAKAGVPKVGVHGLRHSFASLAYHLQVPEKYTMQIGGWADNQTMRKIYTHIAASDMDRFGTKFSDFFRADAK